MKIRGYNSKWATIFLHVTFWLLLFLLPFLIQSSFEKNVPKIPPPSFHQKNLFYIIKFLPWVVLFYLNAHFLVPKFIYKKKTLAYALSLLLILIALSLIELIYFYTAGTPARFRIEGFIMFNFFPFLCTLTCSTVYQMYRDRGELNIKAKEKETENLKTELSFLRSQMSPHFMFNVLNNMVSLARKKSDLLEPSLIKLSSLMRYFLYENDEEKVSLEKEIEYLQSFIDLQQQRFARNVTVSVNMRQDEAYQIEPMLLIPFVENAFKHGMVADATINIRLEAKTGVLDFNVMNKYCKDSEYVKDKTAGIGLANVQRRLDLLYEKNHTLQITKSDGWFNASLHLNLS